MSYRNQRDHLILDRQTIKDTLLNLTNSEVRPAPAQQPREDHLATLLKLCDSDLEKQWLRFIDNNGYRLPSAAQNKIEACHTRPDFLYENEFAAVYIDGPPHDFPNRQDRDADQSACLEDQGFSVIRFHHEDDWAQVASQHPHIFGRST
jgi:very-short-patch-repair endonuclease